MLTINDRIEKLIKHLGYNANSFAVALGYNGNKKIQRLIGTTNKPSVDILSDIKNKFFDVNIEWLITGKGEMFKSETVNTDTLKKCEDEKNKLVSIVIDQTEEINRLKKSKSITYSIEQPIEPSLNEETTQYSKPKK